MPTYPGRCFDRHEDHEPMTSRPTSTFARFGERLWMRCKERSGARLACPDSPFWAHRYYTDGVRLYRFVGWVHRSLNGMLAEFEDCHTLDVLLVSIDRASYPRLRPVLVPSGT
jgi:hypothetical protein